MRGRDAKEMIVDLDDLEKRILNDGGCSGVGRGALLRELKRVHLECESEDKMERWFRGAGRDHFSLCAFRLASGHNIFHPTPAPTLLHVLITRGPFFRNVLAS
jgi:hypothetical protein